MHAWKGKKDRGEIRITEGIDYYRSTIRRREKSLHRSTKLVRIEIRTPIRNLSKGGGGGDGTWSLRPIFGFFFSRALVQLWPTARVARSARAYYFLSAAITAWRGVAWTKYRACNATIGARETRKSELSVQRAARSAILGAARPSSAPAWMKLGVWENRWLSPSPSVSPTVAAGRRSEQPIGLLRRACFFTDNVIRSRVIYTYIYI